MKRALRGRHKLPEIIYKGAEAKARLVDLFRRRLKVLPSENQMSQFTHFYELLMNTQKVHNFTRLVSIRDVGIKHFIDCWMVGDLVPLEFPLLDVGTGPGFPGIPLKIRYPKEKILLGEGVQKRVEFLKLVRDELQLENLPIVGRNINFYFAYPVRSVITRAVEDIDDTLLNVSTCLQTGGKVYFMKGPAVSDELLTLNEFSKTYYKLIKDISYELPESPHKRRLVVFEKIKATPLPDFELEPDPEDEVEGK